MIRLTAAWISAPRTRAACGLLTGHGHRALFVGGCVRNALLGLEAQDVDIATDAPPARVMELAAAAGVQAVPTGIAHGTVTLVLEGRPFEVTTFRRDVATDGRWAEVAFSSEIAEDAARRDFTMNALYAEPDGLVVDPLGGLPDLRARRVRFVGDPARRIAEDYLRILRFFRFHAWYGDPEEGLDAAGLAACAAARDGLGRLSRERVGAEITRLLSAPDPAPALAAMAASGVLAAVLPGARAETLAALVRVERAGGHAPRWQRRLAALGPEADVAERLRLPRAEARALAQVAEARKARLPPAAAAYRFGPDAARDAALIALAQDGGAADHGNLEAEIERGAAARFPLRAADLPLEGPALGRALAELEAAWVASDFTLDAEALRALPASRAS